MLIQNASFCLYVKNVKSTLDNLCIKTLKENKWKKHKVTQCKLLLFKLSHCIREPGSNLNFLTADKHSVNRLMSNELLVIWMRFLYGPMSLMLPSKSGNMP